MKIEKKLNRRKFVKLFSIGTATAGIAAFALNFDKLIGLSNNPDERDNQLRQDVKKTFFKCSACSHTFFYMLNREFGVSKEQEETASDPLAGGLLNTQNQCGMLWGSSLAVGAEAFRRYNNPDQALIMSITATQHLVKSFEKRTESVNCREVLGFDISNPTELMSFMMKSLPAGFTNIICMNLAERWAPEAMLAAKEGLSDVKESFNPPLSCASEVVKKMGADDEEAAMVSGFAGGMGLSGNGCGALAAAVWMSTLKQSRENNELPAFTNPDSEKILKAFKEVTKSEFICSKISGKKFGTIDEHTEFIKSGGCKKIIDLISQA